MRRVLLTLTACAGLALAGGAAVVGLGLYNVSARAGHLPGIPWVLHTTFRNSVELRARPPAEVPPLTDAMAALGARHFDAACRACHGAPGRPAPATVRAMVPAPPPIQKAVAGWAPNELGWIVYNGVKMSGMPHWPAPREDEVWSVVAFLERVAGMDAAAYARAVRAPAVPAGPPGLAYCAGCHGADGRSDNPDIPRLDILDEDYIAMSLAAYVAGERASGVMRHAATLVPQDTLPALAAHFAAQPTGAAVAAAPDPGQVARGRRLAARGDEDVPACRSCHGPWPDRLRPEFPSLAGQHEAYLLTQLRLWREEGRGGGPQAHLMRQAAALLEPSEVEALAAYYASLPPARLEPDRTAAP